MANKFSTFGVLKVRKEGSTEQPLNITYIDEMVAWDIIKQCRDEGFEIVDHSQGYELFRDADRAMDSIRIFCRR
jgi:hypothetical protein